MFKALISSLLAGSLFFAALPSTTNYELNSYGFGSGGTANSTTSNYALEGITGELSGTSPATSTYTANPGFIQTQQANVPLVTLTNPSNYYDKLLLVIDQQGNPTDALYALQVCVGADWVANVCGGTTMYVKSDDTLGSTLNTADYQTYSAWGSGSGTTIIGLSANTHYYIRAKATQGKFTESAYGPSSNASTVGQSITFCLYAGASCGSGNTTSFSGGLLANTVSASSPNLGVDFATNADSGGNVYVYSKNGALQSLSIPSGTIPSSSGINDLTSATQGYGTQVVSAAAGFPSTGLLDNFNRANSSTLGPNWTLFSGFVDFSINSNVAHDSNGTFYGWDYWNVTQYGPDSEAFATVASASADPRRVCVRMSTSRTGYCVSNSSSTWSIVRLDPSAVTLGATVTQSVSVGDKIGIRAIGSTLEAWYYNSASSSWSLLFTRADSAYTAANYIAMESRGSDLDDFGGGTVTSPGFNAQSPFNGTGNNVGQLSTTIQTILSTSAPINGGVATLNLLAKPNNITPAATDYSDTITVIAAASF